VISKSNKAFSLLEVLITVAILSTAVIFVFRSFTASLSSAKFSQNITLACYLAEAKLWEIEQNQRQSPSPLDPDNGTEKMQGRDFNWSYETIKLEGLNLIKLRFNISWQEKIREKEYSMEFLTYLIPKE